MKEGFPNHELEREELFAKVKRLGLIEPDKRIATLKEGMSEQEQIEAAGKILDEFIQYRRNIQIQLDKLFGVEHYGQVFSDGESFQSQHYK